VTLDNSLAQALPTNKKGNKMAGKMSESEKQKEDWILIRI
jgi:hypothetical protein